MSTAIGAAAARAHNMAAAFCSPYSDTNFHGRCVDGDSPAVHERDEQSAKPKRGGELSKEEGKRASRIVHKERDLIGNCGKPTGELVSNDEPHCADGHQHHSLIKWCKHDE